MTSTEQTAISAELQTSCSSWDAHGNSLTADFTIAYNQILILAVDEDQESASGCSIDKATAVFRQFDQKYAFDLFNRMNLTFVLKDVVKIVKMAEIKQAYSVGLIKEDSVFLNNTVSTLSDFRTIWKQSFKESWAFRKVKQFAKSS